MKNQYFRAADSVFMGTGTSAPPEDGDVQERMIGDIIRSAKKLSTADVERILVHQREHGVRFGESAIALGLASREDILWALSQQFHYPYVGGAEAEFSAELVVASAPFSDEAEIFRDLRSQLLSAVSDHRAHPALAVTSASIGDGKSFFAANLAVAFSQLGGRTLLVDADMRTPRQHALFRVPHSNGLSGVLSGRLESNVIQPVPGLPSLYVMPVGVVPPNPLELLQRPVFGMLLRELAGKFDHILVDTPAAQHGADAKVVAIHCGLALTIGRKSKTPLPSLHRLVESLGKGGCKIAGVVMNEH